MYISKKEIVIGNTTYVVCTFCNLSSEEIKAKIERLIKNEAKKLKLKYL